jgi:hypothetical protein
VRADPVEDLAAVAERHRARGHRRGQPAGRQREPVAQVERQRHADEHRAEAKAPGQRDPHAGRRGRVVPGREQPPGAEAGDRLEPAPAPARGHHQHAEIEHEEVREQRVAAAAARRRQRRRQVRAQRRQRREDRGVAPHRQAQPERGRHHHHRRARARVVDAVACEAGVGGAEHQRHADARHRLAQEPRVGTQEAIAERDRGDARRQRAAELGPRPEQAAAHRHAEVEAGGAQEQQRAQPGRDLGAEALLEALDRRRRSAWRSFAHGSQRCSREASVRADATSRGCAAVVNRAVPDLHHRARSSPRVRDRTPRHPRVTARVRPSDTPLRRSAAPAGTGSRRAPTRP